MSTEHFESVLPIDELVQVLRSENRRDFVIGGKVLPDRLLLLYRGDLEPITVPLTWFTRRPGGPKPDPTRFSVTDHGQAVCLGEYQASVDAILVEFDEGDNFRETTSR